MRNLEQVHDPQQVLWTGKLVLHVDRQVAEVQEFEISESQHVAHAVAVLSRKILAGGSTRAIRVLSLVSERLTWNLPIGCHERELESRQR